MAQQWYINMEPNYNCNMDNIIEPMDQQLNTKEQNNGGLM
jgi:hypothetical protein